MLKIRFLNTCQSYGGYLNATMPSLDSSGETTIEQSGINLLTQFFGLQVEPRLMRWFRGSEKQGNSAFKIFAFEPAGSDSFYSHVHTLLPVGALDRSVVDQLDQSAPSMGNHSQDWRLFADERSTLGICVPDVRGIFLYRLVNRSGKERMGKRTAKILVQLKSMLFDRHCLRPLVFQCVSCAYSSGNSRGNSDGLRITT